MRFGAADRYQNRHQHTPANAQSKVVFADANEDLHQASGKAVAQFK